MDRSEESSRLWYNQGTREERGEFQDGSVLIKLCFKVLANVPSQGREINKWGSGWLNNIKSGTIGCPQTSWIRLLHWTGGQSAMEGCDVCLIASSLFTVCLVSPVEDLENFHLNRIGGNLHLYVFCYFDRTCYQTLSLIRQIWNLFCVQFTEIMLKNMLTLYTTFNDSVHFMLLPFSFIALYDELALNKIWH